MPDFVKYLLIALAMAPVIFVGEAFFHGAPTTISENTRNVHDSCRQSGKSAQHCDCVAEAFRASLDETDIALKRIMFIRETIDDVQGLYEAADRSCRNTLG